MRVKLKLMVMILFIIITSCGIITVIIENYLYTGTLHRYLALEEERKRECEEEKKREEEKLQLQRDIENAKNSYDIKNEYYNKLALVMKDGKWGYIDEYGNEAIALEYDVASNFLTPYAKVKKDGKWGYINVNGEISIPIEYYYCSEPKDNIVIVANGGKYGFLNINGNKICDLIYDKVEAFDESGLAKVVLDKKYGYIDKTGELKVPINEPYIEENLDFTGEWKKTNTHSSKISTIIISSQFSTNFDFIIDAKYFAKSGSIRGTADIIKANTAEYTYNEGEISDKITFTIIDGILNVSAKNSGNCGMDENITIIGKYTLDVPEYTNSNQIKNLFGDDEKLLEQIKATLGEENYEAYFLDGFKNGEYKKTGFYGNENILKGSLYTVFIPTLEKDFKLFISQEGNIYFNTKHKEIYATNDENRKNRIPSVVIFDEL